MAIVALATDPVITRIRRCRSAISSVSGDASGRTVAEHQPYARAIEEDFGYLISETIRVTETGVEVLTKAPRKLFEVTSAN